MNNGAFGENFPYSNFHDLNMDWIIKIAKDFLDQYTHIQETIDNGLEALDEKATNLEALLQEWYDTHSKDIANQLADALNDIQNTLNSAITSFNTASENKVAQLLKTIPDDYTVMYNNMVELLKEMPTKMSAGVKGYAVPKDETQVTGTIYQGDTGDIIYPRKISNSNSVVYPVTGIATLQVSGYSWDITHSYALYFFLDKDNLIISKYPTQGYATDIIVDVPANAKYIYVNGDTTTPAKVELPVYQKSFEDSTKQLMKTYKPEYIDYEETPTNGTIYKGTIGNTPTSYSYADGAFIKVDVENYNTIRIQGNTFTTSSNFRICFFLDENDIIIDTVETTQGTHTNLVADVPANAKYALINGDATSYPMYPKAEYGIYNTNFEDRTKNFIVSDIIEFTPLPVNPTDGTIYKGAIGGTPTASSYSAGAFVKADISGYEQISITGDSFNTGSGFRICFFLNANDIIIGTVDNVGGYNDLIVNVPQNTKYALVNGDASQYQARTPTIKVPTAMTNLNTAIDKYNPVTGKTMLLLGDSITKLGVSDRGWVIYFNNIVKADHIDNIAVNGARWTDYNDSTVYDGKPQNHDNQADPQNVIGNQVQRIINNPTEFLSSYDFIMILAGVNDPQVYNLPTPADFNKQYYNGNAILPLASADRSTWAGATRYAIEKLHGLFPNAKIIISTILNPIAGYDTLTPINTSETLRKCAKVCSVQVCDIEECGIRPDDTSMYQDTLHPSAKGAKTMGEYIARWYRNNI